jgi:hypothetical protein
MRGGLLIAAIAASVACRPPAREPPAPPSPPPVAAVADCTTAAAMLAADHRVRALPSLRATGSPRYQGLLRTACRDDGWPPAFLACVTRSRGGRERCDDLLDATAQLRLAARRGILEESLVVDEDDTATTVDPATPEALDACEAVAADREAWASCPAIPGPLAGAYRDGARALRADVAALRETPASADRRQRVEACLRDGLTLRRTARRGGCPLAVHVEVSAVASPTGLPATCALYTAAALAHAACERIAPATRAQATAAMERVIGEWASGADGETRRRVRHRCLYFGQELWRDTADAGCPPGR